MKRALAELVQRNRARGIPDEMLKEKEKELIETAGSVAYHRLKTNFILERIAEQEKIEVSDDGKGGATTQSSGTGLLGLYDRVGALEGALEVSSPPLGGTTLRARIPIPSDSA